MTPEQIQRASELVNKLGWAKKKLEWLSKMHSLKIVGVVNSEEFNISREGRKTSDLFEELHTLAVSHLTHETAMAEQGLRSLGVELPEPDFVNMAETVD